MYNDALFIEVQNQKNWVCSLIYRLLKHDYMRQLKLL